MHGQQNISLLIFDQMTFPPSCAAAAASFVGTVAPFATIERSTATTTLFS
jgi:hypothetical protein